MYHLPSADTFHLFARIYGQMIYAPQEAVQLQWKQNKKERQVISKAGREAEQERRFLLRQQRKREKKRGH
jgi:hypothetical protein